MITLQYLEGGVGWLPLPDYPSCGPEVVLSCFDGVIIAPAAALAALSPLFQSIFKESFCGCNEPYSLIFSEVSSQVVYAFVQLLTTGSTYMSTSYYSDVLSLAASFSIELISPPTPDFFTSDANAYILPIADVSPPVIPRSPVATLPGIPDYPPCSVSVGSVDMFLGFDENLNISSTTTHSPGAKPSIPSIPSRSQSHHPDISSPLPLPSPLPTLIPSSTALRKIARTPKSKKSVRTPKSRKPVRCAICHKMYADIFKLRRHEASIHDGFGEYHQCDVCGVSVAGDRSHLSQHKARHIGLKFFHCKKCPFEAVQAGNLKLHYQSVHQGKRPYQCSACDYSGKLRQHLTRHIRSKHCEF